MISFSRLGMTILMVKRFLDLTDPRPPATGRGFTCMASARAGRASAISTTAAYDMAATRYDNGNLYFYYSDAGYFNNSISEFSQNWGVRVYSAPLTIENSTIENNAGDGLDVSGGPSSITGSIVADNGGHGVNASGGSLSIASSTITDNGGNGINAVGSGTTAVSGSTITGNGGNAAILNQTTLSSTISGNTVSGNGMDVFFIGGTVAADQTWDFGSGLNLIVLAGSVTVNDGATLTIPAGRS